MKKSENCLFYKNNTEQNGWFSMQKVLKVGNKRTRVICNTCSKLSIGTQKELHIF